MGRRTFQVGLVGRDIFLKIYFFFLVLKMTPLKNTKISKKSDVFWRQNSKTYSHLLSQKFSAKFS